MKNILIIPLLFICVSCATSKQMPENLSHQTENIKVLPIESEVKVEKSNFEPSSTPTSKIPQNN